MNSTNQDTTVKDATNSWTLSAEEALKVNRMCDQALAESVHNQFQFDCSWPGMIIQIRRLFEQERITDRVEQLNIRQAAKREWDSRQVAGR